MREAKEVVTVAAQAEQQDLVVVKVEANVERLGVGSCSGKRRGQRRGCGERLMLLRLKGDGVGIESVRQQQGLRRGRRWIGRLEQKVIAVWSTWGCDRGGHDYAGYRQHMRAAIED
ncbi:hypothetical protein BHM03_00061256 [Ensete ventricosum]|nr:hypothetical protein BHM03_00061256 [Ensete ventricosum]